MSIRLRNRIWVLLWVATTCSAALTAHEVTAAPVYLEIHADQDGSSPDPLEPFDVRFILHANGNEVQGVVIGGVLRFTNGNIIGTISEWPNGDAQIVYSAQTVSTFHSIAWNAVYGQGVDPDSLQLGFTSIYFPQFDSGGQPWTGTGELFRIHVSPNDTGTFWYDSLALRLGPGPGWISFVDPSAGVLEQVIIGPPIRVPPVPGAVRFRFSTVGNSDTLYQGSPARIFMNVDAMGQMIQGLATHLQWTFSNGNMVGPFNSDFGQQVSFSPTTEGVFLSRTLFSFSSLDGGGGTNPDTSVGSFISFDSSVAYLGNFWLWSVDFVPSDTGTIQLDSNVFLVPAAKSIMVTSPTGADLPASFIPGRIVVLPCPYDLMGDVNQDAVLTSSDLIYFVNYIFKSGPDPLPHRSVGDANCSGGLGASDIIFLVNHIFKSGAEPCACIVKRI